MSFSKQGLQSSPASVSLMHVHRYIRNKTPNNEQRVKYCLIDARLGAVLELWLLTLCFKPALDPLCASCHGIGAGEFPDMLAHSIHPCFAP